MTPSAKKSSRQKARDPSSESSSDEYDDAPESHDFNGASPTSNHESPPITQVVEKKRTSNPHPDESSSSRPEMYRYPKHHPETPGSPSDSSPLATTRGKGKAPVRRESSPDRSVTSSSESSSPSPPRRKACRSREADTPPIAINKLNRSPRTPIRKPLDSDDDAETPTSRALLSAQRQRGHGSVISGGAGRRQGNHGGTGREQGNYGGGGREQSNYSGAGRGQGSRGGSGRGQGNYGGAGRGGGNNGNQWGSGPGRGGNRDFPGPNQNLQPEPFRPANLDDTAEVDTATARLDNLLLSHNGKTEIRDSRVACIRPGYGTKGRSYIVRTNYFPITIADELRFVYLYKIAIKPALKHVNQKKEIMELVEVSDQITALADGIAFDNPGENLVSKTELGFTDIDIILRNNTRQTVTFTRTSKVDTSILRCYANGQRADLGFDELSNCAMAFNIIFARFPRTNKKSIMAIGKHKYFPLNEPNMKRKMDGGLVAIKGFFTSVRFQALGVALNVNVCTSAFHENMNLAEWIYMLKIPNNQASILGGVQSLWVESDFLSPGHKQSFRVDGMDDTPPAVSMSHEKNQTVKEFLERQHRPQKLRHPRLFSMLLMNPSLKEGSPLLKVPPECLIIRPGQTLKDRRLGAAEMIKHAAKSPAENAQLVVEKGLRTLGLTGNSECLKSFGINVAADMAKVPMRLLEPPDLLYGSRYIHRAKSFSNTGFWKFPHQSGLYRTPPTVMHWINITFFTSDGNPADISKRAIDFTGAMKSHLQKSQVNIIPDSDLTTRAAVPIKISMQHKTRREILGILQLTFDSTIEAFDSAIKTKNHRIQPRIFLVMVATGHKNPMDAALYSAIKYIADVKMGIHTICALLDKWSPSKPHQREQYISNLALKFNLKCGGINHMIQRSGTEGSRAQTMIVGADVTHPSRNSVRKCPSIAAVVASTGSELFNYPASLTTQPGRQEMIENLEPMMIERLHCYREKNNKFPAKIIFYRDGVSESQYKAVLQKEYTQIVNAINRLNIIPRPKTTLVIVGKRHHTRFYPTGKDHMANDGTGNPMPGCVVDRQVTDAYDFDFFLQAHQGIQGSARPCHYYVLKDENNFTADDLQQLTHDLSYSFARATRAVSVCTPAYYADIACERARCYLWDYFTAPRNHEIELEGLSDEHLWRDMKAVWDNGPHPALRDSMFYL